MPALACDLGAVDTAQRSRYTALRAGLGARRVDAHEPAELLRGPRA